MNSLGRHLDQDVDDIELRDSHAALSLRQRHWLIRVWRGYFSYRKFSGRWWAIRAAIIVSFS